MRVYRTCELRVTLHVTNFWSLKDSCLDSFPYSADLTCAYYILGNSTYREIIGVPQGNTASPFIVDLSICLFICKGTSHSFLFNKAFLPYNYVDDILFMHSPENSSTEDNSLDTYQNCLSLTKSDVDDKICNFLERTITSDSSAKCTQNIIKLTSPLLE